MSNRTRIASGRVVEVTFTPLRPDWSLILTLWSHKDKDEYETVQVLYPEKITVNGYVVPNLADLALWFAQTSPAGEYVEVHAEIKIDKNSYAPTPEIHLTTHKINLEPKTGSARDEVIADVTKYVQERYNGDWRKAFLIEDTNVDGKLTTAEVSSILAKAGVGLRPTRWMIALQIVKLMDSDGDGLVSWEEFKSVIGGIT